MNLSLEQSPTYRTNTLAAGAFAQVYTSGVYFAAVTFVLPFWVLAFGGKSVSLLFCGGPSRTRTCDPLIMSQLL
jgi:hypothetical protein